MQARHRNSSTYVRTILLSLVLALSLALTTNPLAAHAAGFVVDDNPANNGTFTCPATSFTTIQSAINAAPAGATITVCPGTYDEYISIAGPAKDGLKLIAKGPVTVEPPLPVPATAPVFTVMSATGIVIRGFRISGAGRYGTTGSPMGIVFGNSSGAIIKNTVTGMARTPADNTLTGIAIVAESALTTPVKLKIQHNTVQGYQYVGIGIGGGVVATITNNLVESSGAASNAPIGIWMEKVLAGKVVKNTVSHDWSAINLKNSTGIQVQDSSHVKLINNKVGESQNGIVLRGTCSSGPTTANVVKNNKIRDGFNTLWLYGDSSNTACVSSVTGNLVVANKLFDYQPVVPGTQYGIYVYQYGSGASVTANSIIGNQVHGFFGTGLMFDPGPAPMGNTILGNKLDLPVIGGLDVAPGQPMGPHDNTVPNQPFPSVTMP